jgi:hypothetical protein
LADACAKLTTKRCDAARTKDEQNNNQDDDQFSGTYVHWVTFLNVSGFLSGLRGNFCGQRFGKIEHCLSVQSGGLLAALPIQIELVCNIPSLG